ncbi:MAG: hypothetical protein PHR55_03455 [Bacilli bacterium]|nr:hypothetical protein [Bacilli bacterium]
MNKSLQILKVSLYNIFGINKFLKKSIILKTGIILLIFYGIISIMFSMGFSSYMLADSFEINMMPLFLSIFISFASLLVFISTMRTSKNNLYDSKDNDLLLSLPLKLKEIITAKILDIYIISFILSLIILIPTFVVFCIKVPVNITFILLYIISIFIIPIIPTIIGSFFGYLIARFIPKSNKKNIVEIILSFFLFFIIMFFQFNISNTLKTIVSNSNIIDNIMKYISYPTYLLREALFNNNILYFILYIVINISLIYIFIMIIKRSYLKLIYRSNENSINKNRSHKELKSSSITKALIIKEKRKFISSPIYLINSSFGIVMLFVASLASLFYSKGEILKLIGSTINLSSAHLILVFILFVVGMTNITASSISIEGSKFWILKSLPVKEKDIIYSKILFSIMVVIPISILSIIILSLSFNVNFIDTLILILFVSIYAIVISKFGMIINLRFPKMDAINDQVVVKQSLSSLITIMGPMFLFIILISVSQFIEGFNNLSFSTISFYLIIFMFISNLILNKLLNTYGVKKIKSII